MSDKIPTPGKPGFDPGWNDPPTFSYSTSPPVPKPKLNLNKRIAFPMQSTIASTTKVQTSSAGLPMPFARHQKPPPPQTDPIPNIAATSSPPKFPPTKILSPPCTESALPDLLPATEQITSDLELQDYSHESTLNSLHNSIKTLSSVHSSIVDELEKRLNIMSAMWLQDRFEVKLQQKLSRIAEAIARDQFNEATELQRSLAIDYGPISSQWASALRQLIAAKQQIEAADEKLPDNVMQFDLLPVETDTNDETEPKAEMSSRPLLKGRILHL